MVQIAGEPEERTASAVEWRPRSSATGRASAGVATLSALCSAGAWAYALTHPIALDSFLAGVIAVATLLLAVLAALLANGYRRLRYRINASAVSIDWLGIRETIPFEAIDGLFRGQRLGKLAGMSRLSLPGLYTARLSVDQLGTVKYYGTTVRTDEALILSTSHARYAITPQDLAGFRSALVERLETLPETLPEPVPEPKTSTLPLARLSLPRDRTAVAFLAGSLLALLASFGYLCARFPTLPRSLSIHFDPAGAPNLVGSPVEAFRLPAIAGTILLLNLVVAAATHEEQRNAARIFSAATLFVQVVMLIALIKVVQ
ncbi:MAG: PH domain-containing protein, partial [Chloroflexi bacterium]|nr:PH domain-containing protein [Chloroflexota bacterium]